MSFSDLGVRFLILKNACRDSASCSVDGVLSDRALKVPPGYCPDSPLWEAYRLDTAHSWQLSSQLIASESSWASWNVLDSLLDTCSMLKCGCAFVLASTPLN